MDEEDTIQEIISGIKELIINVGPFLREAETLEEAEDKLMHLEEHDEKFHRYRIVQLLRTVIDREFGLIMDREMDQKSIHPHRPSIGQEAIIKEIAQKIIKSKDFQKCSDTLKHQVMTSVSSILEDPRSFLVTDRSNIVRKSSSDLLSDGESSLGSSLNNSSPFFMSTDQMRMIADGLSQKIPELRRRALHDLGRTIFGSELHNYEVWPEIQRGVQESIMDEDETIWKPALKFLAKSFSTSGPAAKEAYKAIYGIIMEYLHGCFTTFGTSLPKVKSGIDCNRPDIIKIIRCMSLMNEFQQMIPQYWLRYQETLMEDIIEQTLQLLSISPSTHISPIHVLALIDVRANWFLRWMHGHYSRAPLLVRLEKYNSIITNAVKSCVDYITKRSLPSDLISEYSEQSRGHRTHVYSGPELQYLYFVHSLHVLGQLIYYERGRKFFPVQVKGKDVPLKLTQLIETLIRLITEPSGYVPGKATSSAGSLEPSALFVDMIRKWCSSERVMEETMSKDSVTESLTKPIAHIMDDSQEHYLSEQTLLQIADVLAMIAATSSGRLHLLYGESRQRFNRSRNSMAHVIVEFAKKCLLGELSGPAISRAVIGNLVYVCRQLYATCEGLTLLYNYQLHTCIANAWKQAYKEAERASTPTQKDMEAGRQVSIILWEDTLRDNLLNFAATPKGLLLLQQTGALDPCVEYMNTRYATKVQVGKHEKFGYGYMVSQLASTSAGMSALKQAGFTSTLTRSIWAALEVVDDNPVYSPRPWPTDPLDKVARKPFSSALGLLASFPAVYEALAHQRLPCKKEYKLREIPKDLVDLFDRLIYPESSAKLHSLFNVEHSLIVGLKLLSVMVSCLDTYLLLQTQYNMDELLLQQQQESRNKEGIVMMDQLVIERNYILVKCHTIGGPSERVLPERKVTEQEVEDYEWPIVMSLSIPKVYTPEITSKIAKQDSELAKFLSDTKRAETSEKWIEQCQKLFRKTLSSKPDQVRGRVIQDLLERVVEHTGKQPQYSVFPTPDYYGSEREISNYKLTQVQQRGIELTVRYGLRLNLIKDRDSSEENLAQLLRRVQVYLNSQQRNAQANLLVLQSNSLGFDWLTATIFLLMGGDVDRAWRFLHKFSGLISAAYLWPARIHRSKLLPAELACSAIPPVFSSTCHYVELLLQMEVPQVYNAFKVSGFCPAQIILHWTRQCFWNYLDWPEILHYICLCLLLGVDYQVYIIVALLRFLQPELLQKAQDRELSLFLKDESVQGFRLGEHLEYMYQLEKRFRSTVLTDMQNVGKP